MSRLDFILNAIDLKDIPRKGWVLRGIEEPEDVGSHSWGVAFLSAVYAGDTDLDESKVLKMAIMHDVAEARVGDTAMGEVYQEVSNAERINEEERAWDAFEDLADVAEFRSLWEELETKASPEAEFVADMDLLDMCLTALKYERQDRYDSSESMGEYNDLDGFFETADKNIQTKLGREVYQKIYTKYQAEKGDTRKS